MQSSFLRQPSIRLHVGAEETGGARSADKTRMLHWGCVEGAGSGRSRSVQVCFNLSRKRDAGNSVLNKKSKTGLIFFLSIECANTNHLALIGYSDCQKDMAAR